MDEQGFRLIEKNTEQKGFLSLLLIWITVGGYAFCLQGMFHAETSYIPSLLLVALLAVPAFLAYRQEGKRAMLFAGAVCAVALISATVLSQYFVAGAMDFLNQIVANINYITGWSMEYFVVPQCDNMVFAFYIFFGCLIALITLYLGYSIVRKHWMPAVVFWLPVLFAAVFFEMKLAGVVCCLAIVSILGCFGYSHMRVRDEKVYAVSLAVLTLCIAAGGHWLLGSDLYKPNQNIASLKEYVNDQVDTAKYGEQDFPEGKISLGLGSGEEVRLEVTSDKPGKLYLKGYVGSAYTDGRWELLEGKKYSKKYEGMFQKYRKEQFHPLSQIHSYNLVSKGMTDNVIPYEKAKVTVQNISAFRKFVYLPYGASFDSVQKVAAYHQDLNLTKTLLEDTSKQTDTYEVDVTTQDAILGYAGMTWLSTAASGSEESSTYRDIEADYRKFVYEMYTVLSEEDEKLVQALCPEESQDLAAFTDTLRKNLKKQGTQEDGWDALQYATRGALAFRYAGIPARYVEGYEVSTGDSTPTGSYVVEVTGDNAHAWVEIYKSGIGWIPVDVTPGHYENLTQKNRNSQQELEKKKTNTSQGISRRQKEEKEEQEEDDFTWDWQKILLTIALVLLIIVIVCMVVLLIRWRIIWSRRVRVMSQSDGELAFREVVSFMSDLMGYICLPEEEMPEEIVQLLQAFWFSPGADARTTKEQVGRLCAYAKEEQEKLMTGVKRWKRLKLRFWNCLEFPYMENRWS